jgi:hypothetical protein
MFCDYGCGSSAKVTFANGKKCCAPHPRQCSFVAARAIERRKNKGCWHSEETRARIASTSKETRKTSWLTGKNAQNDPRVAQLAANLRGRKISDETRRKISESKKGHTPWNRGKTSLDDDRIQSGTQNGMFGRNHTENTKDKISATLLSKHDQDLQDKFERYRRQVARLTEKTYVEFYQSINPENYPRTLCGVQGGYQLDHIVPVKYGFENNIPANLLAEKYNLQVIPWQENRSKWDGLTEQAQAILKRLTER